MSETFLEMIVAKTLDKVQRQKSNADYHVMQLRAREIRHDANPHRLQTALLRKNRTNIIAEIKRASPSKGVINDKIDVAEVARNYESGGAAAISVLTESKKLVLGCSFGLPVS